MAKIKDNYMRINIVVPSELDKRVEMYSAATNRSKSDIFRTAAEMYLDAVSKMPEVKEQLEELVRLAQNFK